MEWLVTWLWQGCLVTGVVAGLLRAVPSVTAATRYLVWYLTLAAVVAMPLVWGLAVFATPTPVIPVTSFAVAGAVDVSGVQPLRLPALPSVALTLLAGVWIVFAATRLADVGRQLRTLRRRKRESRAVPPAQEARLPRWRQCRGDGRDATLALSSDVAVASVLGLGRALIVLPPTLMTELTDEELDQIVLHEYAHVQRRDDWSNLAVVLVSAVCGWHPAVWWITRELVQERELACDDWVIRHGGAPQPYLRGLAKVAVLAARPAATELAPGAGATRGQLLRRVTRVLRRAPGSAWRVSRAAGLVAGGFLAASVFWMTGLAPLITFEADDAPAAKLAASRPLLDSTSPDGVDVTLLADVAPVTPVGSLHPPRPARMVSAGPADASSVWFAAPVASAPLSPVLTVGLSDASTPGGRLVLAPPADPLLRSREIVAERLSTEHLTPRPLLMTPSAVIAEARRVPEDSSGWRRLTDVGVAVGHRFTTAGLSTAGAFSAFGGSVKRAFTGQ